MVRELEKQGMTFSRSPVPEKPKRVTQKRLELLSRIKRQTLREYADYTTKRERSIETPIEIYARRHTGINIDIRRPRAKTFTDDYIRKGRKGRIKGSKNKRERTEEEKEVLRNRLKKAREIKKQKREERIKNGEIPQPKKAKPRQKRDKNKTKIEKPPVETETQEQEEPQEPEQEPPEEPVFESDIIIDNIESILAGTTNFKGLAEYLIQVLHDIVNDIGANEVVNNIKNSTINVLDTAISISVEELRYRERAISNASLLIMALTGSRTTFETLENISSKATEDSKDVPQYRPRGFGRGLKVSKHERELQDRMDKELSNAQLPSKYAETIDIEDI